MNLDNVEMVEFTDENGRVRMFLVDGAMQSATYIDADRRNELNFEYMQAFAALSAYHPHAKDVLMIGAGMFSYPKYLISHDPHVRVDALDPDEEMFDYACSYFYLDELIRDYDLENSDRLNFIVESGRDYLEGTEKKYDIIINDAFDGFAPAVDLCTIQAAKLIHDHLNAGGMYLCNVPGFTDIESEDFLCGCMKTLEQEFTYVRAIRAKREDQDGRGMNYVIIASGTYEAIKNSVSVPLEDAVIFRDEDTDGIYESVNWY